MKKNLCLSAKYAPAKLPDICAPRKTLLNRFTAAEKNRFIYIGAPAGSGKTVTALLWLHALKKQSIWINLDQYDNIPSVFYKLLATGIFSTQPENASMERILWHNDFSAAPVENTIRMIAEIKPEKEEYVLVFDDMHLINNAEILRSLPLVLKWLPGQFIVVVLSRKEAYDNYFEIIKDRDSAIFSQNDLRFNEKEIQHYFKMLGKTLSHEEAQVALMATNGWAIAVNALAQSGSTNFDGDMYTFSQYFAETVWQNWDDSLKEFCLCTAIVDEFNVALANRLSGREDSAFLMAELSRSNVFISKIQQDTYRYHHLLQDYLREKINDTTLDRKNLCKIAADYYKENKDYSRALRFWMDSGDYKGIDEALYLFLFKNNRGIIADYADFLRTFFIENFPEPAFRVCPPLHILSAWYYYLTSQSEGFSRHMDEVYKKLPKIALWDSKFVEYAILAYSVDHRTGILEKIKKFNLLGQYVRKFTREGIATSIASFSHNLPYMHRSNLDYSDLVLDRDYEKKLGHTFGILLGSEWSYIKHGLGACFAYEQDNLEEALKRIKAASEALTAKSKPEGVICVLIYRHLIYHRLELYKEAKATLEELETFVKSQASFFLPNLTAYKSNLLLLNGEQGTAQAWLNNYYVAEPDHIEFFRIFQHFTTIRSYIALNHSKKALKLIDLVKRFGKEFNRPLDFCEASVLEAALLWANGKKENAVSSLLPALEMMEKYHYIRTVADEGGAVLPLIKKIAAKVNSGDYQGNLSRQYINEVLLATYRFAKKHKGITGKMEKTNGPPKLSKQQKAMLEYLSKGYNYPAIAKLCGLKISTIKSHTAIAYRKLGVNNSLDAILQAKELGIID